MGIRVMSLEVAMIVIVVVDHIISITIFSRHSRRPERFLKDFFHKRDRGTTIFMQRCMQSATQILPGQEVSRHVHAQIGDRLRVRP